MPLFKQSKPENNVFGHPISNALLFGDIFCTENSMYLGRAINVVSALYSSDRKSRYTHAGIMLSSWETLESLWLVESHNIFSHYQGKHILIARPIGMTQNSFLQGYNGIKKHIGQIYPIHRLFLHILNLAQFIHWNRLVCSELVAKFLYKSGFRHGEYFGTSPDMIADEIRYQLNANRTGPRYEIIFEGVLPVLEEKTCCFCFNTIFVPENTLACPKCGCSPF